MTDYRSVLPNMDSKRKNGAGEGGNQNKPKHET